MNSHLALMVNFSSVFISVDELLLNLTWSSESWQFNRTGFRRGIALIYHQLFLDFDTYFSQYWFFSKHLNRPLTSIAGDSRHQSHLLMCATLAAAVVSRIIIPIILAISVISLLESAARNCGKRLVAGLNLSAICKIGRGNPAAPSSTLRDSWLSLPPLSHN